MKKREKRRDEEGKMVEEYIWNKAPIKNIQSHSVMVFFSSTIIFNWENPRPVNITKYLIN